MKSREILLSTAYFPPVQYMSLINEAGKVLIEREENYIKQTFRNRCYILTANGLMALSVPVLEGSFHKRAIKEIRIDYSRRWQQIHLRSIYSSYKAAPFFDYFYEKVEKIITKKHSFLLDLNIESLRALCEFMDIGAEVSYTDHFEPVKRNKPDWRYLISPKNKEMATMFSYKRYIQVFYDRFDFIPGLSSLDLVFNTGPDAVNYLPDILVPE